MKIVQKALTDLITRCEHEGVGLEFVEKVCSAICTQVLPAIKYSQEIQILATCSDEHFIEILISTINHYRDNKI